MMVQVLIFALYAIAYYCGRQHKTKLQHNKQGVPTQVGAPFSLLQVEHSQLTLLLRLFSTTKIQLFFQTTKLFHLINVKTKKIILLTSFNTFNLRNSFFFRTFVVENKEQQTLQPLYQETLTLYLIKYYSTYCGHNFTYIRTYI